MKKLIFDFANLFLIFIFIEIALNYFFPIKQIILPPFNYFGIILFIIGWIPNIWIYFIYKKLKNPVPAKEKPRVLITSGLFRISRNPNYLGMAVSLFGEAVFFGSLTTFIIPILFFILIDKFNIKFEEKNLENKFGRKYLDYQKKVRRWV